MLFFLLFLRLNQVVWTRMCTKIGNVPILKASEIPPLKKITSLSLAGTLIWIQQPTDARLTVCPPHLLPLLQSFLTPGQFISRTVGPMWIKSHIDLEAIVERGTKLPCSFSSQCICTDGSDRKGNFIPFPFLTIISQFMWILQSFSSVRLFCWWG